MSKKNRLKLNCESCGIEFERCPSLLKNRKHHFCSVKCSNKYKETAYLGAGSPFFGKHHTEENKKKFAQVDRSYSKTQEYRDKKSKISKARGCGGRQYYQFWVKKFGEEGAKIREQERIEKLSKSMSGSGNPMYGKPAPQGSGNGWAGWYKGWYFRSLKELGYLVNVIEKENKIWRSADSKDLRIPYIHYTGKKRTYTADFIVDEKFLIEIKPAKLIDTPLVQLKVKAAIEFCKTRNLEYLIVDCDPLDISDIIKLYNNGDLKFIDRYDKLFKEKYL